MWFKSYPITYILIGINVLVFAFLVLGGVDIVNISSATLRELGGLFLPDILFRGENYRFMTYMFLHGGVEHIIMNMLSLWFVGRVAEVWFGKIGYLSIYFISGIIGALASIYIHPLSVGVGASGAIFGVFGALAGMVFVYKEVMQKQFKDFMQQFGVLLVINFFIGVIFTNVDMSSHIGGLIVGIIGGFLIAKFNRVGIIIYIIISSIFILFFYNYILSIYVQSSI